MVIRKLNGFFLGGFGFFFFFYDDLVNSLMDWSHFWLI